MNNELEKLLKVPSKKANYLYNHFNITKPNEFHQADLLFLSEDDGYRYALCVVDVASRYKASRPMKTKLTTEILEKLYDIYQNDKYMTKPEKLNVDKGSEFTSKAFKDFCKIHDIKLVINEPSHHLSFVENMNKQLAKKLYKIQQEAELRTGEVNTKWIGNLQRVIKSMNNTKTKMIDMKPVDAIQLDYVKQPENKHSLEDSEKHYNIGEIVKRILNWDEYQDLATGKISIEKRRATDTYWSKQNYEIVNFFKSSNGLSLYEHQIKDLNTGKLYPHTYTYFQLQKI